MKGKKHKPKFEFWTLVILVTIFQAKERLWPNPPQFLSTAAEGIRLQQCGFLTFPILCDHAEPEGGQSSFLYRVDGVDVTQETERN